MRNFIIIAFIISGFVLGYGQSQREVRCSTWTETSFAIPYGTDINSVSKMDLISLTPHNYGEYIVKAIDDNFQLSITKYNIPYQRCNRIMLDMIDKTVSNAHGVYIYSIDSGLICHESWGEEDSAQFTLSEIQTQNYGTFNHLFSTESPFFDVFYSSLVENNFTVELNENYLIAANGSLEIKIDFRNLIYETRYFSQDALCWVRQQLFSNVSDIIIPTADINIHYDTLSESNIRYQITDVTVFPSYEITNGDEIVVQYDTVYVPNTDQPTAIYQYKEVEKLNHLLQIYPNPAYDYINVTLPFNMSNVNVNIYNSVGQCVLSQKNNANTSFSVDISSLPQGLYIIKCSENNITVQKKFIKNNY